MILKILNFNRARIDLSCGDDQGKTGRLEEVIRSFTTYCRGYVRYDFEGWLHPYAYCRADARKTHQEVGVVPDCDRSRDRERFNQIVELSEVRNLPQALFVLAEISLKDDKIDEAVDALKDW